MACAADFTHPPSATTWVTFASLAAATVAHIHLTRLAEERRRVARLSTEYIDHTGIWTVCAAVVLPAHLMVSLVLAIRIQRCTLAHKPPVRLLFGTSAILASALVTNAFAAASPIREWMARPTHVSHHDAGHLLLAVSFLVAAALYYFTQTMLLAVARGLRASWSWPHTIGSTKDNRDFAGCICLGTIGAIMSLVGAGFVALLVIVAVVWTRNARQRDDAVIDSQYDALTELYNRRGFDTRAARALAIDTHAAVLMFDLDHFKTVNDTHGHPNGDAVLCRFSATLRQHTRHGDLLCRRGGEEMMALLPATTPEEAIRVAERIRQAVEALRVRATRPAGGAEYVITGLTVSIGVALHPHHGSTFDELEHAADAALYMAKQHGRNQVRLATEPHREARSRPCDTAQVHPSDATPATTVKPAALPPGPRSEAHSRRFDESRTRAE
jgi:diguanylate cyclase (GGDEF)-like protein